MPWLGLAAVVYAVVQLAVVVPHTAHALGWDESVYVSQVDPRSPAAYFSARARAASARSSPRGGPDARDPGAAAVSGRPLGRRALRRVPRLAPVFGEGTVALAALLFSGLWITQVSGPAVMPNLWVALGALAAVGWFLRAPASRAPTGGWPPWSRASRSYGPRTGRGWRCRCC
ncbi:hypothetical protein NKH77_10375 [Streptomyces sp. M19]